MKKLIYCLICGVAVMFCASPSSAEVLTPQQALSRISDAMPMRMAKAGKGGNLRLKTTIEKDNLPCVYVFENNGTNILVSADDNAIGCLGYFDGDASNQAPALKQWIENYAM